MQQVIQLAQNNKTINLDHFFFFLDNFVGTGFSIGGNALMVNCPPRRSLVASLLIATLCLSSAECIMVEFLDDFSRFFAHTTERGCRWPNTSMKIFEACSKNKEALV